MTVIPRELLIYESEDGRCPFEEWLNRLGDLSGRAVIRNRLNRVRAGNLGNTRGVGAGVSELKIDFGPGYRVYFGEDGSKVIVLLIGGDKSSQERDIEKAKQYWKDYNA